MMIADCIHEPLAWIGILEFPKKPQSGLEIPISAIVPLAGAALAGLAAAICAAGTTHLNMTMMVSAIGLSAVGAACVASATCFTIGILPTALLIVSCCFTATVLTQSSLVVLYGVFACLGAVLAVAPSIVHLQPINYMPPRIVRFVMVNYLLILIAIPLLALR